MLFLLRLSSVSDTSELRLCTVEMRLPARFSTRRSASPSSPSMVCRGRGSWFGVCEDECRLAWGAVDIGINNGNGAVKRKTDEKKIGEEEEAREGQ